MAPLNVLITAASRRVALVQGFQQALRTLNLDGAVIVTDIDPLSSAVQIADRAYRVSLATDAEYIDQLLAICAEEQVRLLVPTIDEELPVVGGARSRFERAGVRLAASPRATAEICDDKYVTARHLLAHGVSAAPTWRPADLPVAPTLPVFVKPRQGRGGVNAFPVHSARELEFFLSYVPNPVVQPYLQGPEFTIDLLCDFDGRPLAIVPRERVVVRAGVIDRGRTIRDQRLLDLACDCARVLRFAGPANIQCRIVDGTPVIFEINPRFSGGISLTMAAGADFPLLLLRLALGEPLMPAIGRFTADVWMTGYQGAVFLERPAERLRPVPRPLLERSA